METLNKPKHLAGLLSAATMVLGFAVIAQPAFAGIADTKHNLGSANTRDENHATDAVASNGEICVFCHTPHGADSSAAAPLWNKKLGTTTTYTTYGEQRSATLDGIVGQPGAISLACLSCHDGAQALDNIINAPGSGMYNPTGTNTPSANAPGATGGSGGLGRGWTWNAPRLTSLNKLDGTKTVAMLDTNLSNDHPVGIQYCGGPTSAGAIGTCKDPDFKTPTNGGSGNVWWVDTADGTDGTRQKTDMILYASTGVGAGEGPQVECASCHDPHSTNGLFLRRKAGNKDSTTCLSCHTK